MATKRTKRIDPNAAFNAIVGIAPKEEIGEGTPAETTALAAAPPAEPIQAASAVPAAAAAAEPEAPPAKKLVQKGYYLTEEQVRQLGITAVMKGVDRSSIVRDALDLYFQAEQDAAL